MLILVRYRSLVIMNVNVAWISELHLLYNIETFEPVENCQILRLVMLLVSQAVFCITALLYRTAVN